MRKWTAALALVMVAVVVGCSEGNVFDLEEGDCFGDFDSGDVSDVELVDDCDDEHQNEVYAVFDSEEDGDFPGEDDIQEEANEECLGERFEDYVGISYNESRYFANFIVPSEETWEEADDREIVCYLHEQDGSDIEGSVEGSEE